MSIDTNQAPQLPQDAVSGSAILSEFRIGNFYTQKGSIIIEKVQSTTFVQINSGYLAIEPIPLTDIILRVLGAKFTGNIYFISIPNLKAELHFEIFDKEIVATLKSDFCELIFDNLKYAHRLQNLYFSLTNRELADR